MHHSLKGEKSIFYIDIYSIIFPFPSWVYLLNKINKLLLMVDKYYHVPPPIDVSHSADGQKTTYDFWGHHRRCTSRHIINVKKNTRSAASVAEAERTFGRRNADWRDDTHFPRIPRYSTDAYILHNYNNNNILSPFILYTPFSRLVIKLSFSSYLYIHE